MSEIRIVPAREESLTEVNRLIARSKGHWAWPEGYLEKALPLHEITRAYLQRYRCFEVVTHDDGLLAFASVVETGSRVLIDNLWVAPERIGRGIGRATCNYIFDLARECGWSRLWVLPDPPAEGFYRKVGFADTGERVQSRVIDGPVFSVFCIEVPVSASSE